MKSLNLKRKFSQEFARELREETAKKIKEYRSLLHKDYREIDESHISYLTSFEPYVKVKEDVFMPESYNNLKKDGFGRLFKTKEFKKNLGRFQKSLKDYVNEKVVDIKKEYDNKLVDILNENPLSTDEQKLYLDKQTIQEMSLDDYKWLITRLSGDYASHVTRYGVRENFFSNPTGGEHTIGKGEFVDTFTKLLADGALKSTIDIYKKYPEEIEKAAKRYIESKKDNLFEKSKEELINDFVKSLFFSFNSFDNESVHVAVNDVMSDYGTEKGYDFSIRFPVEVLAHNFQHGSLPEQGNSAYNDWYVYAEDGIPLDIGIVYIPGNRLVDPNTGSQYVLDEKKKPRIIGFNKDNPIYQKVDPDKAITSKQYWENYFEENPEKKPNKIIFYPYDSNNLFSGKYSKKMEEAYKHLEDNIFTETTQLHVESKNKENWKIIRELAEPILYKLIDEKQKPVETYQTF